MTPIEALSCLLEDDAPMTRSAQNRRFGAAALAKLTACDFLRAGPIETFVRCGSCDVRHTLPVIFGETSRRWSMRCLETGVEDLVADEDVETVGADRRVVLNGLARVLTPRFAVRPPRTLREDLLWVVAESTGRTAQTVSFLRAPWTAMGDVAAAVSRLAPGPVITSSEIDYLRDFLGRRPVIAFHDAVRLNEAGLETDFYALGFSTPPTARRGRRVKRETLELAKQAIAALSADLLNLPESALIDATLAASPELKRAVRGSPGLEVVSVILAGAKRRREEL